LETNLDMILWKCLGGQDQVGMSAYPCSAYLDSHRPLALEIDSSSNKTNSSLDNFSSIDRCMRSLEAELSK
jgi:hypothetical protein